MRSMALPVAAVLLAAQAFSAEPPPAPPLLSGNQPPAAGKAFILDLGGGVGMEFAWVTGRWRYSAEGGFSAFSMWVGKYEVSNAEYRKMKPGHDSGSFKGHSLNGDRQPVVNITFDEAMAYAAWLQAREQQAGRLPPGCRYRLLSEFEIASLASGRLLQYPWGYNWPPETGRAGNYADESARGILPDDEIIDYPPYQDGFPVTCDVDKAWPNPQGLFGLGDNAAEATLSVFQTFGGFRGGSWRSYREQDMHIFAFKGAPVSRSGNSGLAEGVPLAHEATSSLPVDYPAPAKGEPDWGFRLVLARHPPCIDQPYFSSPTMFPRLFQEYVRDKKGNYSYQPESGAPGKTEGGKP